MMMYKFDEELQKMVYVYEEDPEQLIKTEEGKEWYRKQLELVEKYGESHYLKLIAEMAKMKEEDDK